MSNYRTPARVKIAAVVVWGIILSIVGLLLNMFVDHPAFSDPGILAVAGTFIWGFISLAICVAGDTTEYDWGY